MKFDMEHVAPDGTVLVAEITSKMIGRLELGISPSCSGCHFDSEFFCNGRDCCASERDGQDIVWVKK